MSIELTIQRAWQRRGAVALALLPVAIGFRAIAGARRILYRAGVLPSHRVGIPVIVVGSILVGGTGKTPLAVHLARALREHGFHPGIVSRGHGGSARAPRAVSPADDPREVGDEPLVIARGSGCPVWIGRNRVAAARAMLDAQPECDVVIADDGLQHYALARDVEIAVIDGRGFGNGLPLPAGPLREPASRLEGVDALVANGGVWPVGLEEGRYAARRFTMTLEGREFRRLGSGGERCGPEAFRGQRVHALAGIGDPARFFTHLRSLGIEAAEHAFPDHHAYAPDDLRYADCDALVMTEKDAVKCEPFAPPGSWVLPVAARLTPDLGRFIAERLHGR